MTGRARDLLIAPHPVLTTTADPVDPADPAVIEAAADLLATLRETAPRTGLSAPQIGLSWRLIAFDAGRHPRSRSSAGELVVVNPLLAQASHWESGMESCVSVGGLAGEVARAGRIVVHGSLPGTGAPVTIQADAFEARCIQHQLDHLDGLLFLDRVSRALTLHHRPHSCDA
ncbi:peptide deformylase [Nonomuraea sp. NPDC046570]|uniref:peptide deformylase n=1 Tax=Nonomuraea sp. NPDC046570 TaxID=3155255 RepID=UPI0033DCB39A